MPNILVIEDDYSLRSQMEALLKNNHHEVFCAENGYEGLELLKSTTIDSIVLDIRMPNMDGIEVLKKIHSDFPVHPPIIIITGHGDKKLAIQAIHFGAFDFLEKPFNPNTLVDFIERSLLEKKEDISKFKSFLLESKSGELTPREQEVAFLVSLGHSNDDIGKKLNIGSETIKSHLKNIFRKKNVSNRTELSHQLKKAS